MPGIVIRDRFTGVVIIDSNSLVPQHMGALPVPAGQTGSMTLPAKEADQSYFYFPVATGDGFAASVVISGTTMSWSFPPQGFGVAADTLIYYGAF